MQRSLILRASGAAELAARAAWTDYVTGRAADEEDLTSRFLTRLGDSVSHLVGSMGYGFDARTFTHRRSGEEKSYGADFGVKLQIDTADQRGCYGWIAQAKIGDLLRWTGTPAVAGLREQCATMLNTTSASFAFLYGPESEVYGANDVAALVGRDSHRVLVARGVKHHFHDFFSGAFGDRAVCDIVFDSAVVRDRRRRYGVDRASNLTPVGTTLALYFGRRGSEGHAEWESSRSQEVDLDRSGSE